MQRGISGVGFITELKLRKYPRRRDASWGKGDGAGAEGGSPKATRSIVAPGY